MISNHDRLDDRDDNHPGIRMAEEEQRGFVFNTPHGDMEHSIEEVKDLASKGDPDGLYALGMAYLFGWDIDGLKKHGIENAYICAIGPNSLLFCRQNGSKLYILRLYSQLYMLPIPPGKKQEDGPRSHPQTYREAIS